MQDLYLNYNNYEWGNKNIMLNLTKANVNIIEV